MSNPELDDETMSTLENATGVYQQVIDLMMNTIRKHTPEGAKDIDDLVSAGLVRLVLQADAKGMELYAIDKDNQFCTSSVALFVLLPLPCWLVVFIALFGTLDRLQLLFSPGKHIEAVNEVIRLRLAHQREIMDRPATASRRSRSPIGVVNNRPPLCQSVKFFRVQPDCAIKLAVNC